MFAATNPDNVSSSIGESAFARWFPAPGYPCGPAAEAVYKAMHEIATHRWGQGDDRLVPPEPLRLAPNRARARAVRAHGHQPERFPAHDPDDSSNDVRAALPAIHVPTHVIQRLGDRINPPFHGRYIASHIPGAGYFEQPGYHGLRFAEGDELDALFAEIEDFLAAAPPATEPARCSR